MRNSALLVVGIAVAPQLAVADATAPQVVVTETTTSPETLRADIGVHAGVVLPQLGSKLGTAVGFKVDGSYVVWRQLALTLQLSYSQPPVDQTVMDPRVPGGSFTSSSMQRELGVLLGGKWRFLPPSASFNGYVGLGAKAYFLKTVTDGKAGGQKFLESTEQSTHFGGAVFGGAELRAGPGAVCLELEVGGSALPHTTTGDVKTTALSLTLGYRFLIE